MQILKVGNAEQNHKPSKYRKAFYCPKDNRPSRLGANGHSDVGCRPASTKNRLVGTTLPKSIHNTFLTVIGYPINVMTKTSRPAGIARFAIPAAALSAVGFAALLMPHAAPAQDTNAPFSADISRLPTGKILSPQGTQVNVGSYPTTLVLSPDGKFVAVSSLGARTQITILSAKDGNILSQMDFNENAPPPVGGGRASRQSLYMGLLWGKTGGGKTTLYASRGAEDRVSVLSVDADGKVSDTEAAYSDPAPADLKGAYTFAGIGASADFSKLVVAANTLDPRSQTLSGSVRVLDTTGNSAPKGIQTPGFPLAVAVKTNGANPNTAYVSSEQAGGVSVLDLSQNKAVAQIATGANPAYVLLNKAQSRLFVANGGSDTVSVIDTAKNKVTQTILVRPAEARGLPSATPLGMALSPDEKTLYVALADMNAVAVIDVSKGKNTGYVPVGWYPASVAVSPDGARLFVANAKGVQVRNPNGKPAPIAQNVRPQYILNIIEGTVSTIDIKAAQKNAAQLTRQTLANNAVGRDLLKDAKTALQNPGIEHIIYIIKENRTYDQVLGDVKKGNGDPSLVLFGAEVTPNLHALADRFVLLDNFYCCAEVSADGWNWSTSGMASEFVSRNTVYGYTGHPHAYDYEGTNNGVAPDRFGVRDAATAPGGYLWDKTINAKLATRNYGFFMDDLELPRSTPEEGTTGLQNTSTKTALANASDTNFRYYDTQYADSEARQKHGVPNFPKQLATYGKNNAPSRFTEWKTEFDNYVKNGNLPRFSMVRFGNDHTAGTTAEMPSPRSMVADNDYAVGQLVDAISHSPYWNKTAIFVVEDDAQNGYDHIDAHRSIAFVISPFVLKNTIDHHFYNTDSTLRTMELLLGVSPMNLYDAIAPPLAVFGAKPENNAPYSAILPAKSILAEVNTRTAYRADFSKKIARFREESDVDEELNDILWHSIKGRNTPAPARRYGLSVALPPGVVPAKPKDDDDD